MTLTRREFIGAGIGLGVATSLRADLGPLEMGAGIRIDAHCHIFNARDVPSVGWLSEGLRDNDFPGVIARTIGRFGRVVTGNYQNASDEQAFLMALLKQGGDVARSHRCMEGSKGDSNAGSAAGRMKNSGKRCRYGNALLLQSSYPEVDLFTPSFVDMYMGFGGSNSNYHELREVAALIAQLTQGRVHSFVPFDPWRQRMYEKEEGSGSWSPFDEVHTWLASSGAIGVKLYPPMGYAPTGNGAYACPSRYNASQHGRTTYLERSGWQRFRVRYGEEIDEVLDRLYKYAVQNEIPILAHANDSNYANDSCARSAGGLGTPSQWRSVLERYPTLRVSFGHFGHFLAVNGESVEVARWASEFAEILADPRYPNVYADVSYFNEILSPSPSRMRKMREATESLLRTVPALKKKLMYGSDWWMLQREPGNAKYLSQIQSAFPTEMIEDFLGGNAVRFMGIAPGGSTRSRLERFYAERGMQRATWMQKLG